MATALNFLEKNMREHKRYKELGVTQFTAQLYKAALQSVKRALVICIKKIGEEHELTANSYRTLVIFEQA